jgi:hypothetical protein
MVEELKNAVGLALIHFVHLELKDDLNDFQHVQLFHVIGSMRLAPIPQGKPFTVKIEIQANKIYAWPILFQGRYGKV